MVKKYEHLSFKVGESKEMNPCSSSDERAATAAVGYADGTSRFVRDLRER